MKFKIVYLILICMIFGSIVSWLLYLLWHKNHYSISEAKVTHFEEYIVFNPIDVQFGIDCKGYKIPADDLDTIKQCFKKYKLPSILKPQDAHIIITTLSDDVHGDEGGLIADIDADNQLEIVIKKYFAGTGRCFELIIIDKIEDDYVIFGFAGGDRGLSHNKDQTGYIWGGRHLLLSNAQSSEFVNWSLLNQFEDLDRDGVYELIIPYTTYDRGVGTIGNWPSIYKRQENSYMVADHLFPDFYKDRILPLFQKELVPEDRIQGQDNRDRNKDCQDIIDRINKLVKGAEEK